MKNLAGFTLLGGFVGAAWVLGNDPYAPMRKAVSAGAVGAVVGGVGAALVSIARGVEHQQTARLKK